jgi:hypothetical protein
MLPAFSPNNFPYSLFETAPPAGASEAVKALGGELRITYQLPSSEAP